MRLKPRMQFTEMCYECFCRRRSGESKAREPLCQTRPGGWSCGWVCAMPLPQGWASGCDSALADRGTAHCAPVTKKTVRPQLHHKHKHATRSAGSHSLAHSLTKTTVTRSTTERLRVPDESATRLLSHICVSRAPEWLRLLKNVVQHTGCCFPCVLRSVRTQCNTQTFPQAPSLPSVLPRYPRLFQPLFFFTYVDAEPYA